MSHPAPTITVALVEDHVMLRDQLTALLSEAGVHVVATAGTIRDGHRAIVEGRPLIAVIDNQLPDGSGIDLCKSIAEEFPEVRVVIHSGVLTAEEERAAYDAGALAVVPKSIRGTELLEAVQRVGAG
jgi:two-component system response regulator DevR